MAKIFEQKRYVLELSQTELDDLYECIVNSDYNTMLSLSDTIVEYVERSIGDYNSEQIRDEADLPF